MTSKSNPKFKKLYKEVSSLKKSFGKKIKTVQELKRIIGPRPRKQKVVMCHGTFDVVHPGHIRQLIYSKSKGDILVVSVTVDKYVTKRPVSPYIPQELRALNLAAFEIVDYVIIDHNPTPIENIKILQPDFFVKGFEYALKGAYGAKTQEEVDAVKSYGGQMVFSPGDIIYSSSKIIQNSQPNLSYEQLLTFMSSEKITFDDLKKTVKKFKRLKVHVIGDTIVDVYSKCIILAPALKTHAFEAKIDQSTKYVGGAGVVAKHLSALGANVTFTTVLGKDEMAKYVVKNLKSSGVKLNAIIDPSRPTTIKERYLSENNQVLLQIDTVDNTPISEKIQEKIKSKIKANNVKAIICSDFRHGIFNQDTVFNIAKAIPKNVLKVADSQVNDRWGNILDFQGFDLIMANEREARLVLFDQNTPVRPLAQKLFNYAKCNYLILKLGEKGIMTYRSPGMELREYFYIDTFVEKLVDPIGAGDALLAAATCSLMASGNIVQASIIGNIAAACECGIEGNVPVTSGDIVKQIETLEKKP
jgi:rfaE bifunctional protein kinase chain/domain